MSASVRQPSAASIFLPCIMGPTGAGKTAATLALAEALDISVINADSRQTYRDFPVITAQPSPEEQRRCPHLLYGFLATEDKLGAGAYTRMAKEHITGETAKGRQPVLVGGTGLYFRALLSGIAPIPPISPETSRFWQERCEAEGSPALHALLTEKDPAYAAKIHANDRQRVTRALEVLEATGKPFSWWHARELPEGPYRPCKIGIGISLRELEIPLLERIDAMLGMGALEEAEKAHARCSDPRAPGWSGIGCAEIYQYLEGKITLDECRSLWFKNTRAYAKRQLTWFRADPHIRWFSPEQTRKIADHVRQCRDAVSQ